MKNQKKKKLKRKIIQCKKLEKSKLNNKKIIIITYVTEMTEEENENLNKVKQILSVG